MVESHSGLPRKTNLLSSGFRPVSATTHSKLAMEKSTVLNNGFIFAKRNAGPYLLMVDFVPRSSIRSPANKIFSDLPVFEHLKKGIIKQHEHMHNNRTCMVFLSLLI